MRHSHRLMNITKGRRMTPFEVLMWACGEHEKVNHRYDVYPYSLHLRAVYSTAEKWSYLVPEMSDGTLAKAAACHDILEDTHNTYNDLVHMVGVEVADIVYAVTNEKGKTRKDRANAKYYNEMISVPGAVFVKLCDRIANVSYSKMMNSHSKYKSDHAEFISRLGNVPLPLLEELNLLTLY